MEVLWRKRKKKRRKKKQKKKRNRRIIEPAKVSLTLVSLPLIPQERLSSGKLEEL